MDGKVQKKTAIFIREEKKKREQRGETSNSVEARKKGKKKPNHSATKP